MSLSVGIIGASGAGIYASLFISKRLIDAQVTLIDQKKSIGKKLLATGNGHCNILPATLNPDAYADPKWFSDVLGGLTMNDLVQELLQEGISLRQVNGLYYPESYHAPTYVEFLLKRIQQYDIRLCLDTKVSGYKKTQQKYVLFTSNGEMEFDKLIFAFGGLSQANLGSDGSMLDAIKGHGYHLSALLPGLAPIRTKESTKKLAGIRHEALLTLRSNGRLLYKEKGEVIFKKDGLSGICVMNAESIWVRNGSPKAEIELDLYPDESEEKLSNRLKMLESQVGSSYLSAILVHELAEYVEQGAIRQFGNSSASAIASILKRLTFHPVSTYGFEDSQVTIGGIKKGNLDDNLQSKTEPGVYFIGECLDNDGLCGGNNLAWCLLTALKVKEDL